MEQEINGLLIADKPRHLSSAQFISRIKKISGINKIGHSGTLDPMATGVMICAVNQATRLFQFLPDQSKKYEATVRLGIETDSLDATGAIVSTRSLDTVSEAAIREACARFQGEISQVPPAYSALKHQGTPLYKYARRGTPVIKPARKVVIHAIRILDMAFPEIRLEVACSSGTYIRTLCADIGNMLGCGGHLSDLRRIECGGYHVRDALTLDEITACRSLTALRERLIPMTDAVPEMPAAVADARLKEKIRHGKPLTGADLPMNAAPVERPVPQGANGFPLVKLIDEDNRLLAVVCRAENQNRYNYCCVFCNP